jgi:hypothetical protein
MIMDKGKQGGNTLDRLSIRRAREAHATGSEAGGGALGGAVEAGDGAQDQRRAGIRA